MHKTLLVYSQLDIITHYYYQFLHEWKAQTHTSSIHQQLKFTWQLKNILYTVYWAIDWGMQRLVSIPISLYAPISIPRAPRQKYQHISSIRMLEWSLKAQWCHVSVLHSVNQRCRSVCTYSSLSMDLINTHTWIESKIEMMKGNELTQCSCITLA